MYVFTPKHASGIFITYKTIIHRITRTRHATDLIF